MPTVSVSMPEKVYEALMTKKGAKSVPQFIREIVEKYLAEVGA